MFQHLRLVHLQPTKVRGISLPGEISRGYQTNNGVMNEEKTTSASDHPKKMTYVTLATKQSRVTLLEKFLAFLKRIPLGGSLFFHINSDLNLLRMPMTMKNMVL